MITDLEQKQQLANIYAFVIAFLESNPTLDASAPRQAFHQARRAGFETLDAVGIEAQVLAAAKAQAKEILRARREWCEENRPAFATVGEWRTDT